MVAQLDLVSNLPSLIRPGPGALVNAALALFAITLVVILVRSPIGTLPGPRGLPFLGVSLQIPPDKQWLKFHEWTKLYGTSLMGLTLDHILSRL